MEHHVFRLGGEVGLGLDREPKHQTPIESSVTVILDVGVMWGCPRLPRSDYRLVLFPGTLES